MSLAPGGIHHITAIAGDPQRNLDFYAGFLGLRLVKRTVNFDDPGAYHFYFGDHEGHPGTLLTFFPYPGARRGRQGAGQVTAVSLAVPPGSLRAWELRTAAERMLTDIVVERFDEKVLRLYDPDGLPVELIETPGAPVGCVRCLHSPTLNSTNPEATARFLTDIMGFRRVGADGKRVRFDAGNGGRVDLCANPSPNAGFGGAGTVHHIAWRTPDDASQREWLAKLTDAGQQVTEIRDRKYFHSIYFREPGGILFEIATDPPGFTVDERLDSLGTALQLPAWLEPERDGIEAALPPVDLPSAMRAERTAISPENRTEPAGRS
jgi:glyoxalase family protein